MSTLTDDRTARLTVAKSTATAKSGRSKMKRRSPKNTVVLSPQDFLKSPSELKAELKRRKAELEAGSRRSKAGSEAGSRRSKAGSESQRSKVKTTKRRRDDDDDCRSSVASKASRISERSSASKISKMSKASARSSASKASKASERSSMSKASARSSASKMSKVSAPSSASKASGRSSMSKAKGSTSKTKLSVIDKNVSTLSKASSRSKTSKPSKVSVDDAESVASARSSMSKASSRSKASNASSRSKASSKSKVAKAKRALNPDSVLMPISETQAESYASSRRPTRQRRAPERFEDRYASEIRKLMIKDEKLDKDIRDTAGDIAQVHKFVKLTSPSSSALTTLKKRLLRSMTQRIRNEKRVGAKDSAWLDIFYQWEKTIHELSDGPDPELQRELDILLEMKKRGMDQPEEIKAIQAKLQASSNAGSVQKSLSKLETELLQPYLDWLKEDKIEQEKAAVGDVDSSDDDDEDLGTQESNGEGGAVTKLVRASREEESDGEFNTEDEEEEESSDDDISLYDEDEDEDASVDSDEDDDVLDWNDTTFSQAARRELEDDEDDSDEDEEDSDEEELESDSDSDADSDDE